MRHLAREERSRALSAYSRMTGEPVQTQADRGRAYAWWVAEGEARNPHPTAGNDSLLTNALRDNLSPETICLIVAHLQPVDSSHGQDSETRQALQGVEWFRDTLLEMVGVEFFNETCNQLKV